MVPQYFVPLGQCNSTDIKLWQKWSNLCDITLSSLCFLEHFFYSMRDMSLSKKIKTISTRLVQNKNTQKLGNKVVDCSLIPKNRTNVLKQQAAHKCFTI